MSRNKWANSQAVIAVLRPYPAAMRDAIPSFQPATGTRSQFGILRQHLIDELSDGAVCFQDRIAVIHRSC
jgi:hypothetical protein